MKTKKNDTKKIFRTKGACSHTFFFLLNREFGYLKDEAEHAADPFAGGLAQEGYQCGMLWGAAMAVGTESFRINSDLDTAIAQTVHTSKLVLDSFVETAENANCSVITDCNLKSKFGLAKFFLSGKPFRCFNLAEEWTEEAINAAKKGLSVRLIDLPPKSVSCASEVIRISGGTDEEMVMVAGFAGGLGLSGNACGALAAAIWMQTLKRVRANDFNYAIKDPFVENIKEVFYAETDYRIECQEICGQKFNSIADHTEFIEKGGCSKLINILGKL